MKKLLLIWSIVLSIAGVMALLFSALQRYGYYNLLDGDADIYMRLHCRIIISFVIEIVLVALGAVCLMIRIKM